MQNANTQTDVLLQPYRLKHLALKNRIISTAHAPSFAEDGHPKKRYRLYHEEKAKGGTALTIIGGSTNVSVDSASVFGQLYAGDDSIIPWFEALTSGVKAWGSAVMCQLTHMGRRTTWDDAAWLPVVSPSGLRERAHRSIPKTADKQDLKRIINDFATAAARCQAGGFDGVEILSHGHLLGQFFSPLVNHRIDEYGGTLENRLRLTSEVLYAIREVVGPNMVIGLRLTCDERLPGGVTVADSVAAIALLQEQELVDYINVLVGAPYDDLGLAAWVPPMGLSANSALSVCKQIKAHTTLPILHAGGINDLATARFALQEAAIDLVGMTRAQIADPHLVNKLALGAESDIRPCVGLGYCVDRTNQGKAMVCGQNAVTGREATLQHQLNIGLERKSIVVVGGGPAGMEAARCGAELGHDVHLLEATTRLGGQLNLACKGVVRQQIIGVTDWLEQRLNKLAVHVECNLYADAEDVLQRNPDLVIVATGGLPEEANFAGYSLCCSSWDVLSGNQQIDGKVLVWDELGNHAGGVIADYLAQSCEEVVFVTPDTQPLFELGPTTQSVVLRSLYNKQVQFIANATISHVIRNGTGLEVNLINTLTGELGMHVVDHVVIENGTQPNDALFHALTSMSSNGGHMDTNALANNQALLPVINASGGYQLVRIGDAVASRNLLAGMLEANRLLQWWKG